jgi:hypothetical protein
MSPSQNQKKSQKVRIYIPTCSNLFQVLEGLSFQNEKWILMERFVIDTLATGSAMKIKVLLHQASIFLADARCKLFAKKI